MLLEPPNPGVLPQFSAAPAVRGAGYTAGTKYFWPSLAPTKEPTQVSPWGPWPIFRNCNIPKPNSRRRPPSEPFLPSQSIAADQMGALSQMGAASCRPLCRSSRFIAYNPSSRPCRSRSVSPSTTTPSQFARSRCAPVAAFKHPFAQRRSLSASNPEWPPNEQRSSSLAQEA